MKKPKSYSDAMKQLELTIQELESDELSMDDLTKKIKDASQLVTYCKEQLRATEKEISDHLNSQD